MQNIDKFKKLQTSRMILNEQFFFEDSRFERVPVEIPSSRATFSLERPIEFLLNLITFPICSHDRIDAFIFFLPGKLSHQSVAVPRPKQDRDFLQKLFFQNVQKLQKVRKVI